MDLNKVDLTEEYVVRKWDGDPPKEGETKLPVEIIIMKIEAGQKIVKKVLTEIAEIQEFENLGG